MLTLERATLEDAIFIGSHLRAVDRLEVGLCSNLGAVECMVQSWNESPEWCWCAKDTGGTPVFLYGVGTEEGRAWGAPWMMGTPAIYDNWVSMLRISRPESSKMHGVRPVLINAVWDNNLLSKRWLEWCGFTLDNHFELANGVRVRRFYAG